MGGKGFQRALGEQHGDIRTAFEGQNVKTSNSDDPPALLKGFCCIRIALGSPWGSTSEVLSKLADPRVVQQALEGHFQGVQVAPKRLQVELQRRPRGSKRHPRDPIWHPRWSWRLKMEAKRVQIRTKRCPRASKSVPRVAPEAPSWLQEVAKSAQVEPKSSPRASKLGGKGFQKTTRRASWRHSKSI